MGKNKPAKNAFYFFVMEYKSKQPKRFDNINDFFQAAGPLWNKLSPAERRPYEEQATKLKVVKYTTTGIDIALLQRNEQEKESNLQKMKDYIENSINLAVNTGQIAQELFYIIHVNYFCRYTNNKQYVPAEIAVARFTLSEGVTSDDVFHMIVKPGTLQVGYSSFAKDISESTHKLPPPFSYESEKDNMQDVLVGLKAFMMQMHPTGNLPPIYAEEKNLNIVENVIDTLIYEYGAPNETFKLVVYPLDYFFYILRNAVGSINGRQVWPQLSNSILQLEKDIYDFCPDITCSFHSLSDAPNHCSKSHVIRNVYIICDHCCEDLDIQLIPGRHVPRKANVRATRPSSRASSASSSYATALTKGRPSTLTEDEFYFSSKESVFSDTSTLVDPDECLGAAAALSENVGADEEFWEPVKERRTKRQMISSTPFQSNDSQYNLSNTNRGESSQNVSRRPVTLSDALLGLSLSNSPGVKSSIGRGRGRGFVNK